MNSAEKGGCAMGIILWIIFGALAGWIASKIMKRDESMGAIANIIVGIIGAALGGWIASGLFGEGITGFNIWSLLIAIRALVCCCSSSAASAADGNKRK
jgi:uncharacterized membrane protein YeaQ/YmgE (transglycosylase-associated protein family)